MFRPIDLVRKAYRWADGQAVQMLGRGVAIRPFLGYVKDELIYGEVISTYGIYQLPTENDRFCEIHLGYREVTGLLAGETPYLGSIVMLEDGSTWQVQSCYVQDNPVMGSGRLILLVLPYDELETN